MLFRRLSHYNLIHTWAFLKCGGKFRQLQPPSTLSVYSGAPEMNPGGNKNLLF